MLQLPEKASVVHFPTAVPSQSQPNELSWQNYPPSHVSMLKKSHPLFLPHVEGSE